MSAATGRAGPTRGPGEEDVAIRIRTSSAHATSTPTATWTPTATTTGVTHTPTVTRTPTATRTAGASWVYLPLVLKAPVSPVTATPTPTQSVTPTRTPSPTATSSGGIYGTVTYNGIAAASISLDLSFYDGSSWSTASTRTTGADGRYNFTGMPALGAGQGYYVRYTNPGNSLYVAGGGAPTITSYSAGSSVPGGNFDIANVSLLTPNDGVSLPLPVTFTWQKRTVPGDTYKWMIFDPSNPADRWGTSDLGNVGSFTLTSLGSGMVNRQAVRLVCARPKGRRQLRRIVLLSDDHLHVYGAGRALRPPAAGLARGAPCRGSPAHG